MKGRLILGLILAAALSRNAAAGASLRIRLDEVAAFARDHSPRVRLLARKLDATSAKRDAALAWSNPELSWEFERVENGPLSEREYTIAIEKEFVSPWVGAASRLSANRALEAAREETVAGTRHFAAEMRAGYAALGLAETKTAVLERFEIMMDRVSRVAASRAREGAISGVDRRLIEMSLIGIRRSIHESRNERHGLMARWKVEMGIPEETAVEIATRGSLIRGFERIDLGGIDPDAETADMAGRRLLLEAARAGARAERGAAFPGVTLSGGYRNAGDGFEGFVLGVSAPLPLLNRNTGRAIAARAESEAARLGLEMRGAARARRIPFLVESAAEKAALLDRHVAAVEEIDRRLDELAVSYGEGWISLADFLGGVEIYAGGIEDFFGLLGEFYDIAFELEALTERELVLPAAPEQEGNER